MGPGFRRDSRRYTYLCLVESVREHGRANQRIIKNLGRKEQVVASGKLDRRLGGSLRQALDRAFQTRRREPRRPLLQTHRRAIAVRTTLGGHRLPRRARQDAASNIRSSAACLPVCCTGSWSALQIAPARSGWRIMTSPASRIWLCTRCTVGSKTSLQSSIIERRGTEASQT